MSGDDSEQASGEWLGSVKEIGVRLPGPDADGPLLEIHGENGMAVVEIEDEEFVDGLTHAAAEVQTVLDDCTVSPATDRDDTSMEESDQY